MSVYGKNHYNTAISLQLIKIKEKKREKMLTYFHNSVGHLDRSITTNNKILNLPKIYDSSKLVRI